MNKISATAFSFGVANSRECGRSMCDKCKPIDDKIMHYKSIALRLNDPQTLEGIRRLIEELGAQKLALHDTSKGT